jgi:uncharacterized protein (TIGR02996 family)
MSEYDVFLAAICENPDDDTPRLVLADWLEERDQLERAAFIRAQVELARTPAWEPFAVLCKWRRPDWLSGRSFRDTLPRVDGFHLEWHAEAFRRGFGWRLNIRTLLAWEQFGSQLVDCVPLGELHLWKAPLDDWRRFAASPIVPRLRRVHFAVSPIEPLIALRHNPAACQISDLYFNQASGTGMPELVEDLLAAPLGRTLRGLHFRMGYESLDLLIEKLGNATRLERLSFSTMGLTHEQVGLLASQGALRNLGELHLRGERLLASEGVRALAAYLPRGLQELSCIEVGVQADGIEALAQTEQLADLRKLDLSRNPVSPRAAKLLAGSRSLAGLRSLILHKCRLGDKAVRQLTRSKFWLNLVELDLRDNLISRAGAAYLLDVGVPPDLTALILDAGQFGSSTQHELRKKYGERLVFAPTSEL